MDNEANEVAQPKPVRMTKDGLYGEPNRPFKPRGFWKDPATRTVIKQFIAEEITAEDAALLLECRVQDIKWHATNDFAPSAQVAAEEPEPVEA